ncbi:MAG: pyridoxal-phosphate dependent enzyme [Pseudobdellovibrionaceae bacterium]
MQNDDLNIKIGEAYNRVYTVGAQTPLDAVAPTPEMNFTHFIKREDLGPIRAYKWRGAYNAMAAAKAKGQLTHAVAASAGNHAQGVALSADTLQLNATIFMPRSTPHAKRDAVAKFGNGHVDIRLVGDTFDEAASAAADFLKVTQGAKLIHPFDDADVIAGQATLACEITDTLETAPDYAFLQIGGGGMAAGAAFWLKQRYPNIRIIGVEGENQASMGASCAAGEPVTLSSVDTFCDGTAVKRPGNLTHRLCSRYLDEMMTVSNNDVARAVEQLWSSLRVIPEPSGAMGFAGVQKYASLYADRLQGKRILSVITGANMDFSRLPQIASLAQSGANRHYYRIHIDEGRGNLLSFVGDVLKDVNVTDFMYGKTSENAAAPVIAFEASPERLSQIEAALQARSILYENVTQAADTRYRVIPFDTDLMQETQFYHVHFPERVGALRELLGKIREIGDITYFNYSSTGEAIGRALMGFETDRPEVLADIIHETSVESRPVEDGVTGRILQHAHPLHLS